MKTIILILFIITAIDCQEFNSEYFPEPKDEETNYKRICKDLNITINFSGLNLNNIKENFLSSPIITCLDLSNNEIYSIDYNAFVNLPNLRYLNLNENKFKLLDIFQYGHANLEILLLDNNTRGFSRNDLFEECTNINYEGRRCSLIYKSHVYVTFPKLKKLFARNHFELLKFTANSRLNFPSLTHLYFSGNQIVHDEFDWLPKTLEYLDLSGHNLHTFTLNDLTNLKWLYLDNPTSKSLHKINLKNLISLKHLSLPSNSINEMTTTTFANLTSIMFLDLADNDIKYIEGGSFDNMENLKYLNLSNNNIEIIQAGTFDKLKNLQTLVLERNLISMFPFISNEINLKRLFLNCNNLRSVIGRTFAKMPQLKLLFLHDNEISYVEQDAFAGLQNLRKLTLSNNKLSQLPNNWMLPMINLEILDLSGNNITHFEHLSLSDSSPLQKLYLSNQLEYIRSGSLLDNVPENVTISLKVNDVFIEKCFKHSAKYSSTRSNYD